MTSGTTSSWVDFQGRPLLRVAQLGRVSGRQQEQEETIKTQISVMDGFVERYRWTTVDRYLDEAVSNEAPLADRPQGSRLWRVLIAPEPIPFQAILVYTLDRWSRAPQVFWPSYWTARSRGVRLISATQQFDDTTDEGILTMQILLGVGHYDKSQIVRKMTAGRHRLLDERYLDGEHEYGYWLGGLVPYGYRQIEHRRRHILIVDDEPLPGRPYSAAEVIRWVFLWTVEERLSSIRIADRLNERGVPTHNALPHAPGHYANRPSSGIWQSAQITRILHDSLYRGEHHYGKTQNGRRDRHRGHVRPMPAIVSIALWHQAQQVLRENQTWADRNAKRNYLLRGLIRCGGCPYTWYGTTPYKNTNSPDNFYYACRGATTKKRELAALHGATCHTRRLRGPDLDAAVLAQLQGFLDNPNAALDRLRHELDTGSANIARLTAERNQLQVEVGGIKEERLRANRRFSRGRMTEEELDALLAEIDGDEENLKLQLGERDSLLKQSQDTGEYLRSAGQFLDTLRVQTGPIASWSFGQQRRTVEQSLREIVVYPPVDGKPQRVEAHFWFRDPQTVIHTRDSVYHSLLIRLAA